MPEGYEFRIGKAHTFAIGRDATIAAAGIMVSAALKARDILAGEGIDAGVINMSTIKPLDGDSLLAAARGSRLVVTAEEHSVIGGLGGAVSEFLSENSPVRVLRIGVKDSFGRSGSPAELLRLYGLTADDIAGAIRRAMK
jgi:transketolase